MPSPFDLDNRPGLAWRGVAWRGVAWRGVADELRPIGESSPDKEPFSRWWGCHAPGLAHLPADLCEQWIYRHWTHSPFSFLPLESLKWERWRWDGETLLATIYRSWGGALEPRFDYEAFHGNGGDDRLPTAVALDQGTWDYPMVLLSTPAGVVDLGDVKPEVRFVIVEGHSRHRYLNALHALGRPPAGPHEVIILSSPLVDESCGCR